MAKSISKDDAEADVEQWDPKDELGITAPLGFFDPLNLCPTDKDVFFEYRAAEIKHGRAAMMASLGAVTQHYVRLPFFEKTTFGEPMPAGLSAATENPGTFGLVVLLLLSGVMELVFWKDSEESGREPGNYGDPLGLGQYTDDMRNREINNGRFAMFTTAGIVAAELATGKDAVQQLGL